MAKKDKEHTNKIFDLKTDITSGAAGEYHPKFVVSFGSYAVDQYLTNTGGLPSGCYVMISSKDEGVFKTTTGNRIIKQVQDLGYPVGVVDAEYKWSFKRGRSNGLNTDDKKLFHYSEPLTGEEALDDVERMMTEKGCKAIMLDSVDGAQPEIGLDNEYGDANIGAHARLFNNAARRLSKMCRKYDVLLLVINQMRGNITNVGGRPQQMGFKASGGRGLPFYSHCNFEIYQGESQGKRVDMDLIPLRISIRRNAMGPSWKDIPVFALQHYGIDPYCDMVDIAVEQKTIEKAGSWYKYNGEAVGQGRESVRDWLEINGAVVKVTDDNKFKVVIPSQKQ